MTGASEIASDFPLQIHMKQCSLELLALACTFPSRYSLTIFAGLCDGWILATALRLDAIKQTPGQMMQTL